MKPAICPPRAYPIPERRPADARRAAARSLGAAGGIGPEAMGFGALPQGEAPRVKSLARSAAAMRASEGTGRHPDAVRVWFRDLLWVAFPARSERDLAAMAAPVLGVAERSVRNWLGCRNDPVLHHAAAVMVVARDAMAKGGRA